jgi:hypothetical protein
MGDYLLAGGGCQRSRWDKRDSELLLEWRKIYPANPLALLASPPGATGVFGAQVFAADVARGAAASPPSWTEHAAEFLLGAEPAAPEEEAGPERGEENWLAFAARLFRGGLQAGVECRAARGGAKIAASFRDGRKSVRRNAALLREKSNEAWIRLMSAKTTHGSSRNPTSLLHGGESLFHTGDGSAREGFAVKLHVQAALIRIGYLDCCRILSHAAK